MLTELALYGLPTTATERYEEVLLLAGPRATQQAIDRVKELAAADGFHSFRVATVDLAVAPDFAQTVRV